MEAKYWVSDDHYGKRVVVTNGRGRKLEHDVFTLSASTTESHIRKMVQAGVSLDHFRGTNQGMKDLNAFVLSTSKRRKSRERKPVRSKAVVVKEGTGSSIEQSTPDPLTDRNQLKLELYETGVSFDLITKLFESKSEKDLIDIDKEELKKIGTALGLERVSVKAVFNRLK